MEPLLRQFHASERCNVISGWRFFFSCHHCRTSCFMYAYSNGVTIETCKKWRHITKAGKCILDIAGKSALNFLIPGNKKIHISLSWFRSIKIRSLASLCRFFLPCWKDGLTPFFTNKEAKSRKFKYEKELSRIFLVFIGNMTLFE